jgi:hypothetical protein
MLIDIGASDRIDASPDWMEASRRDAMPDRRRAHPAFEKLPSRDHAMLLTH